MTIDLNFTWAFHQLPCHPPHSHTQQSSLQSKSFETICLSPAGLTQWSCPFVRIHHVWLVFIEHLLVAKHCLRINSLSSRFLESPVVVGILTNFLTNECNEEWSIPQSGAVWGHPSLGEVREAFSCGVWAGSSRLCRNSPWDKWVRVFQRKKTWNNVAWLRNCM